MDGRTIKQNREDPYQYVTERIRALDLQIRPHVASEILGNRTKGVHDVSPSPEAKLAEFIIALGGFLLVAQLLVVVTPPLIATPERPFNGGVRILLFQIFDSGCHFRENLIVFFATATRMQRRFEAETIKLLVLRQIGAESRIVFLFSIAQSDPPLITSRIDGFRSLDAQQFANTSRGSFILGKSDHDAASLAKSIFIDE